MTTQGKDWNRLSAPGVVLRFVLHENRVLEHLPLHDWLLRQAQQIGIPGGSVFRGIAGYGRHGTLHEERFFELAGDLPLQVLFMCRQDQADQLLERVEAQALSLFYALVPAQFGIAGAERAEWPKILPGVF